MAILIIMLVIVLTIAMFYLKCSLMQSICTLWFAIIANMITFTYYEAVANLFISRGYAPEYASGASFLIVFILSFGLLRSAGEMLIGSNVDIGPAAKSASAVICGFLCGLLFSGNILITMGMIPVQNVLFYSRFDPEKKISLNNPKTPALNADGFVAGLFRMASAGSMRSEKSFSVLHPNFVSQIHLDRLHVKQDTIAVCSREALEVPAGKELHPMRRWEIDDRNVVLVRLSISVRDIADGGAANKKNQVTFFPAQLRLVYSNAPDAAETPFLAKAEKIYPVGIKFLNNSYQEVQLEEVLTAPENAVGDRKVWLDAAFELPAGAKPIVLQFKQDGMADLTSYKIVDMTDENEQALDKEVGGK